MTVRNAPHGLLCVCLLAALLIGVGQAALLPPFEGTDETAHYSYIQQIAETGRWPRPGDKISVVIDEYLKIGPTGMEGAQNYATFFSRGRQEIEAARTAIRTAPTHARAWQPGAINNWQSQHPPLYYVAMAPAYILSNGWSLGEQLFLLRIVSYLIAWSGLCLGCFAALREHEAGSLGVYLPVGIALWPALFPMWYPEMARVGNDSLIALFAAGIFLVMIRLTRSASITLHLLLGLLLGLGLLTKAILLPVAAAASTFLAVLALWVRDDAQALRRRLFGFAVFAVTTAAVCGWWYLLRYVETGNPTGAHDIAQMRAAGGLLAGLHKYFQPVDLVRAPWVWIMTFLWGSTWSYVMPPRAMMISYGAVVPVLAFGCYRALRARPLPPMAWFALLALGFFIAALAFHTAVVISFDGGISPMWYLHAFVSILAPLTAAGIVGILSFPRGRVILAAIVGYALIFLLAGIAINALYFSGCGATAGRNYYDLSSAGTCIGDLHRIQANLSVLSYPMLAAATFAAGWLCYAIGAVLLLRDVRLARPGGAT
jgi:hypothetical protein